LPCRVRTSWRFLAAATLAASFAGTGAVAAAHVYQGAAQLPGGVQPPASGAPPAPAASAEAAPLVAPVDDAAPPPPPPAAAETSFNAPPGASVNVPILMYHFIRDNPVPTDQLGASLSVTPEHFEEQMRLLHDAGAHALTLGDLVRAMNDGSPLPPSSVVLTFDDGFADFATAAVPIMQRYGLRATSFVVSGFVDKPGYMSAAQLQDVIRAGTVIGAHTVHHVGLAHASPANARAEIVESRKQLIALTGQPVVDFAYPAGDFNAQVEQLVAEAGFRDAVTTQWGTLQVASNRFAMRRIRISGGDGLAAFAQKAGVRLVASTPAPPTPPPPPLQPLLARSPASAAPALIPAVHPAAHAAPAPQPSPAPNPQPSPSATPPNRL
jgi:peptidoglycan/xylan/chitin deacetylase (PgdA/CDA1 family)